MNPRTLSCLLLVLLTGILFGYNINYTAIIESFYGRLSNCDRIGEEALCNWVGSSKFVDQGCTWITPNDNKSKAFCTFSDNIVNGNNNKSVSNCSQYTSEDFCSKTEICHWSHAVNTCIHVSSFSKYELGTIAASLFIGVLCSCIAGFFFSIIDTFGLKTTLAIATIINLIGCILQTISWSVPQFFPRFSVLVAGRFISGVAVGIMTFTTTEYVREVANVEVVSVITVTATRIFVAFGLLFASLIGFLLHPPRSELITTADSNKFQVINGLHLALTALQLIVVWWAVAPELLLTTMIANTRESVHRVRINRNRHGSSNRKRSHSNNNAIGGDDDSSSDDDHNNFYNDDVRDSGEEHNNNHNNIFNAFLSSSSKTKKKKRDSSTSSVSSSTGNNNKKNYFTGTKQNNSNNNDNNTNDADSSGIFYHRSHSSYLDSKNFSITSSSYRNTSGRWGRRRSTAYDHSSYHNYSSHNNAHNINVTGINNSNSNVNFNDSSRSRKIPSRKKSTTSSNTSPKQNTDFFATFSDDISSSPSASATNTTNTLPKALLQEQQKQQTETKKVNSFGSDMATKPNSREDLHQPKSKEKDDEEENNDDSSSVVQQNDDNTNNNTSQQKKIKHQEEQEEQEKQEDEYEEEEDYYKANYFCCNSKYVLLSILLAAAMQLNGYHAFTNFGTKMAANLGVDTWNSLLANLMLMLINFVAVVVSIFLSRYFTDVKKSFVLGVILCGFSLLIAGLLTFPNYIASSSSSSSSIVNSTHHHLHPQAINEHVRNAFVITTVTIFIIGFQVLVSPCVYVLSHHFGEIGGDFSEIGHALTEAISALFNIFVVFFYPVAVDMFSGGPSQNQLFGQSISYIFFGGISIIVGGLLYFMIIREEEDDDKENEEVDDGIFSEFLNNSPEHSPDASFVAS